MSYNISGWNTVKLDNFRIELTNILDNVADGDVHYNKTGDNSIEAELDLSEQCEIEGVIEDGLVFVYKIHNSGASSGRRWECFRDLLVHSTGTLIATQVWEGGDCFTRLTVKNGEVIEENIELI